MAQDDIIKCVGLVTQYNQLAGSPGALTTADDAVIRRENIIETRRGYKTYASLGASATQLFVYNKRVLAANGTSLSYDNGSGTFSTYAGSYSAPSGYLVRSQEASSNAYLTTSNGVYCLMDLSSPVVTTTTGTSTTTSGVTTIPVTSASGIVRGWGVSGTGISSGTTVADISSTTITLSATATVGSGVTVTFTPTARKVGAPKCLDLSVSLVAPAGSGIMASTGGGTPATGTQCAYRAVCIRTDQNNNILYGYPSPRAYISNFTGAGKDVQVTMYFTSDFQAGDVVQFYRTTTAVYSSGGIDGAGDECHLVYSKTVAQADIATGHIQFNDIVVDSLASTTALLYTNPSQEGGGQANERPPLAKDIALYKSQYMFYANTTTKQRLFFTLIGTSGLTGNTITLAGATYQFNTTEDATVPRAAVSATGVAANDIDLTARSLVRVINRYSSNTSVYAFYLSSGSDTPGQIMIEERGVGGSAYTLQSSNATIAAMFNPAPPLSPSTTSLSTSSNNVQTNYLYYSKSQQPEAVPLLNYLPVGPSNRAILRIAPLRDSLIVIKEEGIYRLTGDSPSSFTVTLLDPTVFCKAANSVAILNNSVFLLSNQGVVAVTDTGVQVVSREIEPLIIPLITYSNLSSYTYGCAYDSERMYELSTMTASTDTSPTQTFIYNVFTKTWTRKTYAFTTAIVEAAVDKMYFVKSGDASIYVERKSFTDADYSDPETTVTLISVSGSTVVFSAPATLTPTAGYSISQNGTEIPISSITTAGANWSATMSSPPPASWGAGAATLYPLVQMSIAWNSWEANAPALLKRIRQVAVLTDDIQGNNTLANVTLIFTSDLDQSPDLISVNTRGESWGVSSWGDMAWGGTEDTFDYRVWPPKNKAYARLLTVGVKQVNANQKLSIAGVSYTYDIVSERTSR